MGAVSNVLWVLLLWGVCVLPFPVADPKLRPLFLNLLSKECS